MLTTFYHWFINLLRILGIFGFGLVLVGLWNWSPIADVALIGALILAGTIYERRWQAQQRKPDEPA